MNENKDIFIKEFNILTKIIIKYTLFNGAASPKSCKFTIFRAHKSQSLRNSKHLERNEQ